MDSLQLTALIIFILTYLGIIFTRLPGISVDRPSAAFFGAVAMILFGVVSFEGAMASVDFNTIALLLGMMIIITTLRTDGFFAWLTGFTVRLAPDSVRLLTMLVFITGFGSAFLVNDAAVLIITPITISICHSCKLNPVPYLIAVILSSNAGSVMTMTGNPQNMIIGINSGLSYGKFFLHLLPVAILSMVVVVFIVRLLHPSDFRKRKKLIHPLPEEFEYNARSMRISVPVFCTVLVMFFLSSFIGISIPVIALSGASVILLFGKIKPSVIISNVDWVLLLFFSGLFIVVHAVEHIGLLENIKNIEVTDINLRSSTLLHLAGLGISQIISNVPYVIAILPVAKPADSEALWLILASSSTLAGNATIIGAVANLIVIETAAKMNVKITFFRFFYAGIISTILSMIISILIIQLQIAAGLIS